MLDLEASFHAEGGAFFDRERLLAQGFQRAFLGQVDDYVRAAFHFQAEREQDHLSRVIWVRESVARADAEGLFPFAEGFIVLVCGRLVEDLGRRLLLCEVRKGGEVSFKRAVVCHWQIC